MCIVHEFRCASRGKGGLEVGRTGRGVEGYHGHPHLSMPQRRSAGVTCAWTLWEPTDSAKESFPGEKLFPTYGDTSELVFPTTGAYFRMRDDLARNAAGRDKELQ